MLARQVLARGVQRTMRTTAVVRGAAEWDDTEPMVHTAPQLNQPMIDTNRSDYLSGSDERAAQYKDWQSWYDNFMAEQAARTQGFKEDDRNKGVVLTGFGNGGEVWTTDNVWEARHYAPKFASIMMQNYRVQRGEKLGTRLEMIGSSAVHVYLSVVGFCFLLGSALIVVAEDSDTGNGNPQF